MLINPFHAVFTFKLKIFFSLLFIYLTHCAPAQFLEFGLGTGVFNYSGDMARGYHFETMNSGFNIFNRLNFSSHVSLKTTLGFGAARGVIGFGVGFVFAGVAATLAFFATTAAL